MTNKSILLIILVVLIGIFAFSAMDYNQSPVDQLTQSVEEVGEEIQDEADDLTTQ